MITDLSTGDIVSFAEVFFPSKATMRPSISSSKSQESKPSGRQAATCSTMPTSSSRQSTTIPPAASMSSSLGSPGLLRTVWRSFAKGRCLWPHRSMRGEASHAKQWLRSLEEVLARGDVAGVVEVVDERDGGRDVEFQHLLAGELVEVHDDRPQRVAVGDDQDIEARLDVGKDVLLEVRQGARGRVLQRFALLSRRGNVVGASPDLDLLLA